MYICGGVPLSYILYDLKEVKNELSDGRNAIKLDRKPEIQRRHMIQCIGGSNNQCNCKDNQRKIVKDSTTKRNEDKRQNSDSDSDSNGDGGSDLDNHCRILYYSK